MDNMDAMDGFSTFLWTYGLYGHLYTLWTVSPLDCGSRSGGFAPHQPPLDMGFYDEKAHF